jgi:holo-[acyl-carrier protein] synthase
MVPGDDDVVAEAVEVLPIAEVAPLLESPDAAPFTPAELAFARSKSDPDRRLAARLAAKRAAARLLGPGLAEADIEVVRVPGRPPLLRLSAIGERRLKEKGAARVLLSLTHGRDLAAAVVLLLRGEA